jgi:hypothetical protein
MPRRPESRGSCAYCGETITKRGVKKHLANCPKRQEILLAAEESSRPPEQLWHLRVQDAYDKDFWLDLEMKGSSSLQSLDNYLRAIWLECCGHLSEFTIGGWRGTMVGMTRKANKVFEPGLVLRHLYDFGSTSETDIRVTAVRDGKPTTRHPIALLARNLMAEAICQECDQPARWLCQECFYEDEKPGLLCDQHVEGHPHESYGEPTELVNSPRVGLCGYDGPAEPPY